MSFNELNKRDSVKEAAGIRSYRTGRPAYRKGRIIILILTLLFVTEVIFDFLNKENGDYFLKDKKEAKICFNKAVLSSIYKNFTSIPYSSCRDFNFKKASGTYRIFLLGEASLSGWPYTKEEAIENKIEDNLKRFAPSQKFEVITISFAGFNSFHAADIIPQVLKYKPDLIILYSGHNEFYGYKGGVSKFGLSDFSIYNGVQSLFVSNENIKYDVNTDDFELIVPLSVNEKFITRDKNEYDAAIDNYGDNLSHIAGLCRQNKTGLILTELADNNLMPPVGISNDSNQLSTDIIFNNARMALLRDGNEVAAAKLFTQAKELDLFRLRMPVQFSECLKKAAKNSGAELAEIKSKFSQFEPIPGNNLFVDYIHPNITGLNIIAAEYSRMILNKFLNGSNLPGMEDLIENQKEMKASTLEDGNQIEKLRIEKATGLLKSIIVSQKFTPASIR